MENTSRLLSFLSYNDDIVYLKALAKTAQNGPVAEVPLKELLKEEFSDKAQFARLFKEEKTATKGMNFDDFKARVDEVNVEEAE